MRIARVIALACASVAGFTPAGAAEIGGKYAAQPAPGVATAETADSAAVRLVEITAHRQAYSVVYETSASRRKRRGWGLLDKDQLVVAPSTGGSAYGVAIYHHAVGEQAWSGPWMSSLDGGASLGTIRFEDGGALEGRHEVICARPGAGSVSGSVEIRAAAEGYQLTFRLGRAVYYRGVGLLLADDRLAVGWSFGSAPEVVTYQLGANGSLAERHISWTPHPGIVDGGQFLPISGDQYLEALNQPMPRGGGSEQMPLFAAPTDGNAAELPTSADSGSDAAALILGPAAPQVKAWSYGALMRQYGKDGWAERWLERQLTLEELRLLHASLQHNAGHEVEDQSVGTQIENERAREAGR